MPKKRKTMAELRAENEQLKQEHARLTRLVEEIRKWGVQIVLCE